MHFSCERRRAKLRQIESDNKGREGERKRKRECGLEIGREREGAG